MEIDSVTFVFRDLITTALYIVLPLLIIGTTVAIAVGVFQSMTQIQEQTLSFTPKLLVSGIILFLASSSIFNEIVQSIVDIVNMAPEIFMM